MRIWGFLLLSLVFSSYTNNYANASLGYINRYSHIAVDQMHQSGIPASIKMAQALLESGAGKSTLAVNANNHFGIKCGGQWTGDTFYREDDDYRDGKLIKSCFRKFKHPEASFIAHSEFLMNQSRYSFLFSINKKDYKAWAKGLRKAGYATDKAYPEKLINIIEKYKLYELDNGPTSEPIYASVEVPRKTTPDHNPNSEKRKNNSIRKKRKSFKKRSSNKDIARKNSKRRQKNTSSNKYHIVEVNESIADIAKSYRIKESSLRIRNRLPKDAEPIVGEKIYLRKKISLLRRPQFIRTADSQSLASSNYIF